MDKVTCTNCGAGNTSNAKYCSSCGYELPRIIIENTDDMKVNQSNEQKLKKGKLLQTAIGIVVFAISYFVVQQIFFKTPNIDKALMEIASELNKSCPMMVDAETRLDNAIALPPNVFQYNYTLINYDKATVDTLSMKNYLEPTIINFVKSNPQMKYQRDHRTTINYYYKDKNGLYLFLVSATPDKYNL